MWKVWWRGDRSQEVLACPRDEPKAEHATTEEGLTDPLVSRRGGPGRLGRLRLQATPLASALRSEPDNQCG